MTWLTVGAVVGGFITDKLGDIRCGRGIERGTEILKDMYAKQK